MEKSPLMEAIDQSVRNTERQTFNEFKDTLGKQRTNQWNNALTYDSQAGYDDPRSLFSRAIYRQCLFGTNAAPEIENGIEKAFNHWERADSPADADEEFARVLTKNLLQIADYQIALMQGIARSFEQSPLEVLEWLKEALATTRETMRLSFNLNAYDEHLWDIALVLAKKIDNDELTKKSCRDAIAKYVIVDVANKRDQKALSIFTDEFMKQCQD